MKQSDWRRSADIVHALSFLEGRLSSRQIGLFVIACARRNWEQITEPVLAHAGEVAERFVLGRATSEELDAAFQSALPFQENGETAEAYQARALYWMTNAINKEFSIQNGYEVAAAFASLVEATSVLTRRGEAMAQMAMLRDVFGDPFDPVIPEPAWFTSTVVALAHGIYEERAFDRLPILADALQDAGCEDPRVLNHCREQDEHVCGCWVVDMVLGHERPLTAAEWDTTTDVGWMIRTAWPRTTHRKLRLFACGCCRQITEAPNLDWWWWPTLLAAERVTDGLKLTDEQQMCLEHDRYQGDGGSTGWAFGALSWLKTSAPATVAADAAAWLPADAIHRSCDPDGTQQGWDSVANDRRIAPFRVMRCVLGNPLRPPIALPKKWRTPAVVKLARDIYDNHSFERMPELAERLERVGCTDTAVLAHCRDTGPFPDGVPAGYPVPAPPVHTRGCWVVDAVLGLE